MSKRRGKSGSWTTKTYRSPLWKYVHPLAYLGSEYRKAKRAMRPGKVFLRVTSLDQVAKLGRTTTTRVNATTRQQDLARAGRAATKKTAAKKTAAKRPDPYAVAAAIPGQNRVAAAKMAKATQPAKKAVAVRKKNGQFDGSKAMNDRDRATWQAALGGHIDPQLKARTPRRRG